MASATIEFPDMTPVLDTLKEHVERCALEVAKDVEQLIKDKATLEGLDVNNQAIQPKIPKPKKNPKNFPNLPLVQTGNMYDHERWTIAGEEWGAAVTYSPPDYLQYVIATRPWILPDKINETVRQEIAQRLHDKIKEGEPS